MMIDAASLDDLRSAAEKLQSAALSGSLESLCAALDGPTAVALATAVTLTVVVYGVGIASGNISQVDKLWSIVPSVYATIYATHSDAPVIWLMWSCVSVWSIRLTLNFNRKGGYQFPKVWQGEEDYRWVHVRKMMGADTRPVLFHATFHAVFIAMYQMFVLFGIAMPIQVVYVRTLGDPTAKRISHHDAALSFCFFALVTFESVADNQQWSFQSAKAFLYKHDARAFVGSRFEVGFLTDGLFGYCRHPNFFAEMAIWCVFYLFGVNRGVFLSWNIVPLLCLLSIFSGSTPFTEKLSLAKYPRYAEYSQFVPMLLPYGSGVPSDFYEEDSDEDE